MPSKPIAQDSSKEVTRPTCPAQPRGATSTVTLDLERRHRRATPPAPPGRARRRESGRRRGRRPSRTAPVRPRTWWTTGRNGAKPMPPPTTSTSDPSATATGQPTPNGPRTPTIEPGREAAQRPGRGADGADRVTHLPARSGAAAHRDRHLAGAERVEHRELAGPVVRRSARPRLQPEGDRVGGLHDSRS